MIFRANKFFMMRISTYRKCKIYKETAFKCCYFSPENKTLKDRVALHASQKGQSKLVPW